VNSKEAKITSLVYGFEEELASSGSLCGPDPDYGDWIDNALFVDSAICSDNSDDFHLCETERAAWRKFKDASDATFHLLELYKQDAALFQTIARQLSFLPCLMSHHPNTAEFNQSVFLNSQLGKDSICGGRDAMHLARQSWPVRYSYAIIETIDVNLDTFGDELPRWAEAYGYGVKWPMDPVQVEGEIAAMNVTNDRKNQLRETFKGAVQVLPKWTESLTKIHQPFMPSNVLDYWRTGKEMILEELPDFHLRPEWKKYRDGRKYANGAKKGAVQHAIFKDILVALKTMATGNNSNATQPAVDLNEPP